MQPNHQRIPFDDNRKPFLTAISATSGAAVPVTADPSTGALLMTQVGGSSGKVTFLKDISITTTVVGAVTTYVKTGVTNSAYTTQTITMDSSTGAITKVWS